MREIKFRGMTIDGEWFYGLVTKVKEGTFISNSVGRPLAYQVRPETIGQYTELKDKNGKEIYEGDIIKIPNSNMKSIVFFKDGCFMIENLSKTCIKVRSKFEKISCNPLSQIVIGNIYENPELLKEVCKND